MRKDPAKATLDVAIACAVVVAVLLFVSMIY